MQSLKREKLLRIFKLNTGQDDHAIMFMDDYNRQVNISHSSHSIFSIYLYFLNIYMNEYH